MKADSKGLVVVNPDASLTCLVIFIDVDLGKERLIEEASSAVIDLQVSRETISSQVQRVDNTKLVQRIRVCSSLSSIHPTSYVGLLDVY